MDPVKHVISDGNYILIGEDHIGGFAFNFNNPQHVKMLLKLIIKARNHELKIWYEGPNINAMSLSFKQFQTQLKTFLRKEGLELVDLKINGWELNLKFDRIDEITNFTLGCDEEYYHRVLPKGPDTLLDAMVESTKQGNFKGSLSTPATRAEFILALSEGNSDSEILKMIQEKGSNKKNRQAYISKIWNDRDALRSKYYKGTPGALTSSQIYRRIDNINVKRDKKLSEVMKKEGGIFLAGWGHVDNIKQMGLL